MRLKRAFAATIALLVFATCTFPAFAQTSKGIIAGIVRDKTGAAIANAKVTVTSQETSETRSSLADELGAYNCRPKSWAGWNRRQL